MARAVPIGAIHPNAELNTASNLSVPSLCLGNNYPFFFFHLLLTGFQFSVCDLALLLRQAKI